MTISYIGRTALATGSGSNTIQSNTVAGLSPQSGDRLIAKVFFGTNTDNQSAAPPSGEGWSSIAGDQQQSGSSGERIVTHLFMKEWGSGSTDNNQSTFIVAGTTIQEAAVVVEVWRATGELSIEDYSWSTEFDDELDMPDATSSGTGRVAMRSVFLRNFSATAPSLSNPSDGTLAYTLTYAETGSWESGIGMVYATKGSGLVGEDTVDVAATSLAVKSTIVLAEDLDQGLTLSGISSTGAVGSQTIAHDNAQEIDPSGIATTEVVGTLVQEPSLTWFGPNAYHGALVAVVVADTGSPSPFEQQIIGLMETWGLSATLVDDSLTAAGSLAYDLIVTITLTVAADLVTTTVPMVSFPPVDQSWDASLLIGTAYWEGSGGRSDTYYISDWENFTVRQIAGNEGGANIPSGLHTNGTFKFRVGISTGSDPVPIVRRNATLTEYALWVYHEGDFLSDNSTVAPSRRVACSINLFDVGGNTPPEIYEMLKAAIVWALGGEEFYIGDTAIDAVDLLETNAISSSESHGTQQLGPSASPSGIATVEAHGTQIVEFGFDAPSLTSAEAFGTTEFTIYMTTTGKASDETHGATQVNIGELFPSPISSLESIGSHLVAGGILTNGISTSESYGTAILTTRMAWPGLSSLEMVGSHLVSRAIVASGIATSEAHGSTDASTFSTGPEGVVSEEAFGALVFDAFMDLSGLASLETHGSTLALAVFPMVLTGIATGQAFGTTVLDGEFPLVGLDSTEAIGSVVPSVEVPLSGLATGEAHGTHLVTTGALTNLTGLVSGEAHGSTVTAPADFSFPLSGLGSDEQHGSQAADSEFDATFTGLSSDEAFGSLLFAEVILPTGLESKEAHGSKTLSLSVDPVALASGEAFGTAALGSVSSLTAIGFKDPDAVGLVVLDSTATLPLTSVTPSESYGATQVVRIMGLTGIASNESHGAQSVSFASRFIGITSEEAHGSASLSFTVFPVSLASGEATGSTSVVSRLDPSGIASGEAFGSTVAGAGAIVVSLSGIGSLESVGTPETGSSIFAVAIATTEAFGTTVLVVRLPFPPPSRTLTAGQDGYTARVAFPHDPDSVLDYAIDWNEWLPGTSVASVSWNVDAALTNEQDDVVDGVAVIWISSAGVSPGAYPVSCTVTDDDSPQSRTDRRTFYVRVGDR